MSTPASLSKALFLLLLLTPFQAQSQSPQILKNWQFLTLPARFTVEDPQPGLRVTVAGRNYDWKFADVPGDRNLPLGPITTYASTEFMAPSGTHTVLDLNTTSPVTVRLNGTVLHATGNFIPVKLRPGQNQLLLKTQTTDAPWTFSCALTTRQALADRLVATAVNSREIEPLKSLLDSGIIPIDARGRMGLTPLQAARMKGHTEVAAYLLSRGADPTMARPAARTLTEDTVRKLIGPSDPGLAVLVAQNGRILFEKGYGLADVKRSLPVTPRTLFHIGSITKQFTAAAILKLQEQGRLSVSDPLAKYLPDYPRGTEITLAHLLSHTSGIHNYTEKPDFMETVNRPVSLPGLVKQFRNDPLDFTPGDQWYYSNSNYVLLAYIMEKVSGWTYADFLHRTFFIPLALNHTGVYGANAGLAGVAQGYEYLDGKFTPAVIWDMSRAPGAGSLYSNVEDLFRWTEALFQGRVLNPTSLASAFTPFPSGDNNPERSGGGYGFGFFLSALHGEREIHHGGTLHGFSSFLLRLPRHNFTVVVLANSLPSTPGVDTARLARDIAEFFVGEQLASRPANTVNHNISRQALEAVAGRYDYGPAIMTVSVEGGHAYTEVAGQPRYEIFPKSEIEFFWQNSDAQVTFVKNSREEVTKAIQYRDGYTLDAPRLASLDAASLDAILGRYEFSRPGKSILTITRLGNRVFAQFTGELSSEILPRSPTEFYWKGRNEDVVFVKDEAGQVTKAVQHRNGLTIEAPKVE